MAKDLVAVRSQAQSISANMKKGNTMASLQAMHNLLATLITEPLMKDEKKEFEEMAYNGLSYILADKAIRESIPVELEYVAGKEKELIAHFNTMMEACQNSMKDAAEKLIIAQGEKRKQTLSEGIALCEQGNMEGAERKFKSLYNDPKTDPADLARIGETYMGMKMFEEAAHYLARAIELDSSQPQWYNLIAIALRKMNKFKEAEQYYLKVSKVLGKDPHLFFNLARLYLDWKRWPNAIKAAEGAIKLDPNFEEAQKLINYVKKQQEKEAEANGEAKPAEATEPAAAE